MEFLAQILSGAAEYLPRVDYFLTRGTGLPLKVFVGLCAISFLGSLIAAALGLGGGMLVLATMALVLPPAVLIPIHGVVQLGSNLGRATLMWRQVAYALVPAFLIGTILGAAVGVNVVLAMPKWALMGILGVFVLYATWAPKFKGSKPARKEFFLLGAVSTFVTMFVGATGVLVGPFVAAACEGRREVVATHATVMVIQHGLKVVAFGLFGFAFGPYLPLLVSMLVLGFVGTWIGGKVLDRLPEKNFRLGLQAILTIMGLRLLHLAWKGYPGVGG